MKRFKSAMCHYVKSYYKCEDCEYKVYSKTGLKLHTKKVHSFENPVIRDVDRLTCGVCKKSMVLHSKKRGNCP